jgi:hypothetical protein
VLVDDLVDVLLVDVRVPGAFRIHDDARAFLAAIEAAGGVDAHAPGPFILSALMRDLAWSFIASAPLHAQHLSGASRRLRQKKTWCL